MVPLPVRGREVVTRRSEDRRADLVARARTRSLGPERRCTAEVPYSSTVHDDVWIVSDSTLGCRAAGRIGGPRLAEPRVSPGRGPQLELESIRSETVPQSSLCCAAVQNSS